jgi:hypothetical protein
VKRLHYFFNHIKDNDLSVVDQRANVQNVPPEDFDTDAKMIKWMEEGTNAIAESKKFIELI